MAEHHKNLSVLSGDVEPRTGGRVLKGAKYPYMVFDGDTWRKKAFFEEAKVAYDNKDSEGIWTAVKKVWIDFNISTKSERVRMRKQGRLNTEYMLSLAEDNCPCCGKAVWYGRCNNMVKGYQQPSLDRIDPDGGYIDENVWIICKKCNTRKSDAKRPEDLIKLGLAWYNIEKERLSKYKKYTKDIPELTKFFS